MYRTKLYVLVTVAGLTLAGLLSVGAGFLRTGGDVAERAVAVTAALELAATEWIAAAQGTLELVAVETAQGTLELVAAEKTAPPEEVDVETAPPIAPREEVDVEPVAAPDKSSAAPDDTTLYLTVPKMGLRDSPVPNTNDPAALEHGAIKLPQAGFPWQKGANTYIAGHLLGYQGTGSYMLFAELPNMAVGDKIVLEDADGVAYNYRVSELMIVTPYGGAKVMKPVAGRDMVTLQTCLNPPTYDKRLVVRADKV